MTVVMVAVHTGHNAISRALHIHHFIPVIHIRTPFAIVHVNISSFSAIPLPSSILMAIAVLTFDFIKSLAARALHVEWFVILVLPLNVNSWVAVV